MRREASGRLMRIYVSESDRCGKQPAYIAAIEALRAAGITGATVFKGIAGFGSSGTVRTSRVFDLSTNLPVLIEVAEEEEKLLTLLPALGEIAPGALVTLENLTLVTFGPDAAEASTEAP